MVAVLNLRSLSGDVIVVKSEETATTRMSREAKLVEAQIRSREAEIPEFFSSRTRGIIVTFFGRESLQCIDQ